MAEPTKICRLCAKTILNKGYRSLKTEANIERCGDILDTLLISHEGVVCVSCMAKLDKVSKLNDDLKTKRDRVVSQLKEMPGVKRLPADAKQEPPIPRDLKRKPADMESSPTESNKKKTQNFNVEIDRKRPFLMKSASSPVPLAMKPAPSPVSLAMKPAPPAVVPPPAVPVVKLPVMPLLLTTTVTPPLFPKPVMVDKFTQTVFPAAADNSEEKATVKYAGCERLKVFNEEPEKSILRSLLNNRPGDTRKVTSNLGKGECCKEEMLKTIQREISEEISYLTKNDEGDFICEHECTSGCDHKMLMNIDWTNSIELLKTKAPYLYCIFSDAISLDQKKIPYMLTSIAVLLYGKCKKISQLQYNLGTMLHHCGLSKRGLNMVHRLGLAVTYAGILKTKKQMAAKHEISATDEEENLDNDIDIHSETDDNELSEEYSDVIEDDEHHTQETMHTAVKSVGKLTVTSPFEQNEIRIKTERDCDEYEIEKPSESSNINFEQNQSMVKVEWLSAEHESSLEMLHDNSNQINNSTSVKVERNSFDYSEILSVDNTECSYIVVKGERDIDDDIGPDKSPSKNNCEKSEIVIKGEKDIDKEEFTQTDMMFDKFEQESVIYVENETTDKEPPDKF